MNLYSYNPAIAVVKRSKAQRSYVSSEYKKDAFERTSAINFTAYPKILLFDDVAEFIKKGDLNFIEKLPDPHIINKEYKSLLHISTEEKQLEISKNLLARGLDINQKDKMGRTPFAIACSSTDENLFNLFLNYKPYLNVQDFMGNTPLHNAIENQKIMNTLLDKGANPYIKNSFGLPILHEAAEDIDALEFLLRKGISPDSINDEEQTILHTAAIDGNKKLADLLLNHGAEKNFRDKDGKTPLFYSRDNEMVTYWLQKDAMVDVADNDGRTALFDFLTKRDIKSVFTLLKNRANPNIMDKSSKTPILYAPNNVFRKLLLQAGADPNVKTANGSTLLHLAVQKDNEEVINTLLEYNANTNIFDKMEQAPLYYAKSNKIRRILLENGANPDEKPYLHWALKTDNNEFFNDLLKTDLDVNIEDRSGKTPIFYCKKAEDAEKLINKGAYLNYQDDKGNTPLHQYYATGNTEMINAIKDLGADGKIVNYNGEFPQQLAEKFKKYDCWIK